MNGDFIRSLTPPDAPKTLGVAPGASSLRAAVHDDTYVFARGALRLWRIAADGGAENLSVTTAGVAPIFLSPGGDVVFDSDNGYFRASKLGDGGAAVPFGPRAVSRAAEVSGGLVLLADAWSDTAQIPKTSTLYLEVWTGGTTLTLGTAPNLAAIAVDSRHVYALRIDGARSGVVRAKLPPDNDGVVEDVVLDPALVGPVSTGVRSIAVDDTHVYWSRPSATPGGYVDVVKRSKCGGALTGLCSAALSATPMAITRSGRCGRPNASR